MSDLIYKEDAIKLINKATNEPQYQHENEDWVCGLVQAKDIIQELPSAEPQGELVSKKDAKEAVACELHYKLGIDIETAKDVASVIEALPPADAVPKNECERCFDEFANKITDLEEEKWIPVSERLPDELAAVNITWVNHNPPPYYKYTKDVPLVDSAVYYRGKWYWWDATVIDLLGEYDGAYIHGIEPIDKDIEVVAWMPLPTPYKGGDDE